MNYNFLEYKNIFYIHEYNNKLNTDYSFLGLYLDINKNIIKNSMFYTEYNYEKYKKSANKM